MKNYFKALLDKKTNVILLILALNIFIAIAGYFYYINEENGLRQAQYEELKAVAELKENQLAQWQKERTADAYVASHSSIFINEIELLLKNKISTKNLEYIKEHIKNIKEQYGYKDVLISSDAGDIFLSTNSEGKHVDSLVLSKINETVKSNQIVHSGFYLCNLDDVIHYDVIAQLKNKFGKSVAFLILRVDPNQYLYPLIRQWPTKSETSETQLLRLEGDSILFLNELRYQKNTALNLRIPISNRDIPAVAAAKGYSGIFEGVDYKGVDVFAYVTPIKDTQWFIVTKIDKAELYEDLYYEAASIFTFVILLILFLTAGLSFIYSHHQKNIYAKLWKAEEEFKTTLYCIGDAVITTNKYGTVNYMNPVAEQLTGWKEADAKNKPLEKVFNIINEETRKIVENPVDKILREGIIVGLANHTLLISKDGKEIPIADSGAPIISNENELAGIVLVFRDQTKEYEAQKAIKESEKKYRELFENMMEGFAYCKMLYENGEPVDFIYLDVNQRFENLTGIKNVVGKKVSEVIPGIRDTDPELFKIYGEVSLTGEPKNFEIFIDSLKMWFSVSVYSAWKEYFVAVFDIITERKFAEEIIKKSELFFRTTLYSIGDAVITTDNFGKIQQINFVAEKITGWKEHEAKGRQLEEVFEIINEETKMKVENSVQKVLQDGNLVGLTNHTLVVSRDGREIPILESGSPIKGEDGSIMGVVLVFKDQTLEHERQKQIRESEAKFRKIFETTFEGIYVSDNEENIISVNPRMEEMLGYSVNELIGKKFRELLPDEELKDHYSKIERRKLGISETYERKLLKKNGSIVYTFVSATPQFDSKANYAGSFGMFTDITENKLAEEELRKLFHGVEQSPTVILISDKNGVIEYVNPKFCEVTGYSYAEVIGQNPRILKSGNKSKEDYKELWDTVLSGNIWKGEFQNRKKNGELYWESSSISPIKNDAGKITHFIAIKEDITDQKLLIKELRAAKEKAEEMNKVKSNFFANMSHELRTPFIGIMGYAYLLKEIIVDEETLEMVNGIITGSERLTDTLTKILEVTKLEFDKTEVFIENVNVSEIIERVYKQFVIVAERKNLAFYKSIHFDTQHVRTDKKLVTEILDNLVNNAVKYTLNGSIEISGKIKKNNNEKHLILEVRDTGIGIAKDKQEIIWEEFRQASEGTTRSFQGTGLGLSIAKKYVGLLGGKIYVQSVLNEGSTFVVELPIKE